MDIPSSDVLDCCEAAFLFDLAREDVWLYNNDSTAHPSEEAATSTASSSPFASYDAAQHRRVPSVEWTILRVVLHHALRSCRALGNSHEVDNFIVTTLLDAKPMTASAVVMARERFVGKRLPTPDLVRMVSRAGPLVPHALDHLHEVFQKLLAIEKFMAQVVAEERNARSTLTSAEAFEWGDVASSLRRVRWQGRYTHTLHQQHAAQQLVVDAYTRNAIVSASRRGVVPPPGENANGASSPPDKRATERASTASHEGDASVTYLDTVVGAQLHQTHAQLSLLHEALDAAAVSLQSSTWCRDPMQQAVGRYTDRLDSRVAGIETNMKALRASVHQLCRIRAGRRLVAHVRHNPSKALKLSVMDVSASAALLSAAAAADVWKVCTRLDDASAVDAPTAEEMALALFSSLAMLMTIAEAGDEQAQSAARVVSNDHLPPGLAFLAFDYFAEYCDVYPSSASTDTRWLLFVRYAAPVPAEGSRAKYSGPVRASQWFSSHWMSAKNFTRFLTEWASFADVAVNALPEARGLRAFLFESVVPRWMTAPPLQLPEAAS